MFFNPHPHLCGLFDCAKKNEERRDGDPNGFVIGLGGVRRWIDERFQACWESVQAFTDLSKPVEMKENKKRNEDGRAVRPAPFYYDSVGTASLEM